MNQSPKYEPVTGTRPDQGQRLELSDETVELIAAMLRVIADPTRIRLMEILNDRGGATVSALTASLDVTQQNASKQLGVLYQAGIVSRRREGNWVRYELIDWTG